MNKHFFSHLIGLVGMLCIATGCYREEIAELHNQIDAIEFREVTEQLNQMKTSVESLESLKTTLAPQIESLTKKNGELSDLITNLNSQIGDLKGQISATGSASEELKGKLSALESQLKAAQDTIKAVQNALKGISSVESSINCINDRIAALEGKNLDKRLVALENAQASFVTIDSLNILKNSIQTLKESVDAFDAGIVAVIVDAIKNNQDQIAKIISESPTIQALFKDYCKTSDLNNAINGLKENEIADLADRIEEIRGSIKDAITDAINALDIDSKLLSINNDIDVLEQEIAKIGDLTKLSTTAKDNLVNAINELASMIQENSGEFDAYYDTTEVKNLLSALESTLAIAIADGDKVNADSINSLAATVQKIANAVPDSIEQHINDAIAKLGDIVTSDQLVGFLTAADIAGLARQGQVDTLLNIIGTADNKGTIIARIAALEAVNVTIESKNYSSWGDAVKAVYDSLINKIGRINISAIQGNIDAITSRVDSIAAIIGGNFTAVNTVAKAINDLKDLFGDLEGSTVEHLIDSLAGIQNAILSSYGTLASNFTADSTALANLKNKIELFLNNSGYATFKGAVDTINMNINSIKAIIGAEFSSSHTVASAVDSLRNRINALEQAGYGSQLTEINSAIEALQAAMHTKADTTMFVNAKATLDSLVNAFNNIKIGTSTGIKNILEDMNAKLNAVNDTTGAHRSEIEALKRQIADISTNLNSNFLWQLLSGSISDRFTALIENYTQFREILARLNKLDVQFVYIPDYLFGDQITVNYHNGNVVGGASLAFNVYSTRALDSLSFNVDNIRGLFVQTQKIEGTKAAPANAVKPADVSFVGGVLLVTFGLSDIQKYFSGGSIAIVYGDFSGSNYSPWYSTSYYPIHFISSGEINMQDLSGNGLTFDNTKSVLSVGKNKDEKTYKILLTGVTAATGMSVS